MPVDPNYIHADVPHERTVQPEGYRYGCHSALAGPGPRGGETVIIVQNGWYETWIEGQPVRLPVWQRWTTQWLEKRCATAYPPVMGPCAGCENNVLENPDA